MASKSYFSFETYKLYPEESSYAPEGKSNKDLDPTPMNQRTWGISNYVYYWISDAVNISTYEIASSMLTLGMSLQYAIPCVFLGHFLIAIPITLQGSTGASLRVPFPIQARSSFGHHFAKFAVFSRMILAWFWFGVQCYTGSECVRQILISWAPSFRNFPNHLSESANITSAGILCYFLYWVIQFPFLLIHPSKIKWFFMAKSIYVPIVLLGMFIWALKVAGTGPIFSQKTTISGSTLGWAFMSSLNSVLGNYATLSVNIPDFTRYAKTKQSQYIQMFIIPVVFTLTAFVGIVVTSAGEAIYGTLYWDPTTLINAWGDDSKSRAARFFVAFAFVMATIGTNVSANSISAANDMTALFPRYINIKRGQIVTAFLGGWCLCPWEILSKALGFLNFMSGYTVFLGPICGILVTEQYIVRKGRVDVPGLYGHEYGRYYFTYGINWRAMVAMLVTVPPGLPGLAAAINSNINVGDGATHLYDLSWLFGFITAGFLFSVLSLLWPAKETLIDAPIYAEVVDEFTQDGTTSADEKGHKAADHSVDVVNA